MTLAEFADRFLAWLLTYGIHSTLLLLGVALLVRLRLAGPPHWQEMLWRLALVGGIGTATLQQLTPVAASHRLTLAPATPAQLRAPARNLETRFPAPAAATRAWSGREMLAAGLLAAMAAGALRLLVARLRLQRRLARRLPLESGAAPRLLAQLAEDSGLRRAPRLSVSPDLASPIAFGIVRREICLPPDCHDLSEDELRGVLAHELAHHLWRDPRAALLRQLVKDVLFCQPLNRLACRRLDELAEYRCDDWAVQQTRRATTYATSLTRVAGWLRRHSTTRPSAAPVLAMAATPSLLARRVQRLLERPVAAPRRAGKVLSAALGAGVMSAVISFAPGVGATEPATGIEAMARQLHQRWDGLRREIQQLEASLDAQPGHPRLQTLQTLRSALQQKQARLDLRMEELDRVLKLIASSEAAGRSFGGSTPVSHPREE